MIKEPTEKELRQLRMRLFRNAVEAAKECIDEDRVAYPENMKEKLWPLGSNFSPGNRVDLIGGLPRIRQMYARKYAPPEGTLPLTAVFFKEFGGVDPKNDEERKQCLAGLSGHEPVYGFRNISNDALSLEYVKQSELTLKGRVVHLVHRLTEVTACSSDEARAHIIHMVVEALKPDATEEKLLDEAKKHLGLPDDSLLLSLVP